MPTCPPLNTAHKWFQETSVGRGFLPALSRTQVHWEPAGNAELPTTPHIQGCLAIIPDHPVQRLPLSWQICFPHTEPISVCLRFPGCGPPSDTRTSQIRLPQDSRHTLRCVKALSCPQLSLPTRKPQISLLWFYQPPFEGTFGSCSAWSSDNKSVYPEKQNTGLSGVFQKQSEHDCNIGYF